MLSALAGGEALEIIVKLTDLTGAGFKKVQGELVATEAAAGKSGGKVGGFGGALGALAGPLGVAAVGLGAVAGAGIAIVDTYQKTHAQTQLLDEALQAHGSSLAAVQDQMDGVYQVGVKYGFGADDVRAAVTRLTQAGVDFTTIQKNLPGVLDLANAKQLSAADAADLLAKATLGQARGLTDLGIKMPPTIGGLAGIAAAQKVVTSDSDKLTAAQAHLADVEHALSGKHKLTASEAKKLADAHKKVDDATAKLKDAQDKLTTASDLGANASKNFAAVSDMVKGSTGDTSGSVDGLRVAQEKLSNKWEDFSTRIGPGLMAIFAHVIDALTTILGFIGDVLSSIDKPHLMRGQQPGGPLAKPTLNPQAIAKDTSSYGRYATGGYIPARPGGTPVIVGEGGQGEYVIPESRLRSAGGSMPVVQMNLYVDGREMAYSVEPHLGSLYALRGTSARLGSGA